MWCRRVGERRVGAGRGAGVLAGGRPAGGARAPAAHAARVRRLLGAVPRPAAHTGTTHSLMTLT